MDENIPAILPVSAQQVSPQPQLVVPPASPNQSGTEATPSASSVSD